ncbi:MAG: class II aldolase [Verrucomicrobiales bacterium]|nr:class II aldolase [Verrucomicrobiales bacterium]|tara:strand:+ start:86 stop:1132 length:1047 start_codon:yes stop_codon:yes gene_type:complete
MKKVITARDVEAIIKDGGDLNNLPAGSIVTPSARDLIRAGGGKTNGKAPSVVTSKKGSAAQLTPFSEGAEWDAILDDPANDSLKEEICEMGRRLWARAYVDGNGGNMSIRIGDNIALCTPTLVSKGSMAPEDICLVDLDGKQLSGRKKRTSEILMHLQIMKKVSRAKAVCHCHPPHATAFAVAGVEPPTCMIPEMEVFIGKAPLAPYRTPGTPEMGKLVSDLAPDHNTILMANHGVVSWSHNGIEDAYFKMEIIEAYCRTVWVASQLGADMKTFSKEQMKDLLELKKGLDIPDPRSDLKECQLCDNNEWRPGVSCEVPAKPVEAAAAATDPALEEMVKTITDEIMARM